MFTIWNQKHYYIYQLYYTKLYKLYKHDINTILNTILNITNITSSTCFSYLLQDVHEIRSHETCEEEAQDGRGSPGFPKMCRDHRWKFQWTKWIYIYIYRTYRSAISRQTSGLKISWLYQLYPLIAISNRGYRDYLLTG